MVEKNKYNKIPDGRVVLLLEDRKGWKTIRFVDGKEETQRLKREELTPAPNPNNKVSVPQTAQNPDQNPSPTVAQPAHMSPVIAKEEPDSLPESNSNASPTTIPQQSALQVQDSSTTNLVQPIIEPDIVSKITIPDNSLLVTSSNETKEVSKDLPPNKDNGNSEVHPSNDVKINSEALPSNKDKENIEAIPSNKANENSEVLELPLTQETNATVSALVDASLTPSEGNEKNRDNIRIMSLNACMLGESPTVDKVRNLCNAIRKENAHVVCLQEVFGKEGGGVNKITKSLNSLDKEANWQYIFSECTGRNYERAAFIYDQSKLSFLSARVLPEDPGFDLIRYPYFGWFEFTNSEGKTVQLEIANVHLQQRNPAHDVSNLLRGNYFSAFSNQAIQILAGDMNCGNRISEFDIMRGSGWRNAINTFTNLLNNKEYDNIWIHNAKGMSNATVFPRSSELTKKTFSDHMPVSVTVCV